MNRLRIEIEPDFETAQQLYPTVLELIANYLGSIGLNHLESYCV